KGRVVEPFTMDRCRPLTGDGTLQPVKWRGGSDLTKLAGQAVQFRFHLTRGKLYSFWVSDVESGASNGYVAAGGPGFVSNRDTVGRAAYAAAKKVLGRDAQL